MAYIYIIHNKINNKKYIGQTTTSLEQRFKEHTAEAKLGRVLNRPLYHAMKKHGIENFFIEKIEEVADIDCEIRERYWIDYYDTYRSGYNATQGGEGRSQVDYKTVAAEYNKVLNCNEVARRLSIHPDTVYRALQVYNITPLESSYVSKKATQKAVLMFSLSKVFIQAFESMTDAGRYLIANGFTTQTDPDRVLAHISAVCNGKRKTAYGHKWELANITPDRV